MDLQAIRQMLATAFEDSDISLQADGNRLGVRIVSDRFEGLSRVKRQQMIYALLGDRIKDGEIHAVSMETLTPGELESS